MKMLRNIGAGVIVVVAAGLIWFCCVMPWRCNRTMARITAATERLMRAEQESWKSAATARANLQTLDGCADVCRDDVDREMLAAANLRVLGRNEEAVALYEHALTWDRRPELYLQLGVTQVAAGLRETGINTLRKAVRFNPRIVNMVDDAGARDALYRQIATDHARGGNLLRNPDFRIRSRKAAASFSGQGLGHDSAAANWPIYNGGPGATFVEVLPSTRPGDQGLMLHIRTTNRHSGVEQVWASRDGGPGAVETSAWVFVNSGQACIGSGKYETVDADIVSTTTGKWEQIRGRASRCPVAQTVVFSCDGPADFYITGIEAHAIADAPPCAEAPDSDTD